MKEFQYVPITLPIDVAYREHHQPIQMLSHHHSDYEVIYIVEGRIEFTIGEKTYIAERHNLLFINNVESHKYKVLDYPYKRFVIMMKPHFIHSTVNDPLLTSILYYRPDNYSHLIQIDPINGITLLRIISMMMQEFEEKKPIWETSLKFLFYQLLVIIYRISKDSFPLSKYENSNDHKYKSILEIQKYIESNCTQDLSLTALSEQFHIDMYYLCHLFKEITGYTFKSYLLLQRISKAKELLFSNNDNITDVGFNSGFNNINHFIKTFKKYTGVTPNQYRKEYKDITM